MGRQLTVLDIMTIQKWEHCIVQWVEAYCSGLEAKAAQIEVKKFSSHRFTSHCHAPETVACSFD
ncbi:hypothetical protein EDD18DRAFT_1066979 [Armillaria luteobubalina]|uniref:Uncharacterized protein n=1 Tax=Armillaria luteobubalina TaxID=153913 RepID=A0AA39QDG7_9AGAR|nr:hypothetical protein EDD18DRAFT_1066979 [Armillaria luteobubalina]